MSGHSRHHGKKIPKIKSDLPWWYHQLVGMQRYYYMPGRLHAIFNKKLRSGPSTESFLVFGDFEYSKFLNSFLAFFLK